MKRALHFILAGGLLAALLATGGVYWLEKHWLPEQLGKFSLLGEPLSVQGTPAVSFFPLRLELKQIFWKNESDSRRVYFTAAGVQIIADVGAMLGGNGEFIQVVLEQPNIKVWGDGSGAANNSRGETVAEESPLSAVHSLIVRDGSFTFEGGQTSVEGQGWRISLTNLRPRQEMRLQCAGDLNIRASSAPAVAGHLAIATPLRYYAPNITFQGASVRFTPAGQGLWHLLNPLEIRGDGAINGLNGSVRIGSAAVSSALFQGEVSGTVTSELFEGHLRLALGKGSRSEPFTLDGDVRLDGESLQLQNTAIARGALNALGSGKVNFVEMGKLADLKLQWAEGDVWAALQWDGESFTLETAGKNIQLGEVLDQLGVPGLSGCPTRFAAKLNFKGADAAAMRRSVRGQGQMQCRGLALEPFGELGLLLPLLGRDLKFPDMIEDVRMTFAGSNGIFAFAPVTAQGKGISCQGEAEVNLVDNSLKGRADAKLLGLSIPISFEGPLDNVNFRINAK